MSLPGPPFVQKLFAGDRLAREAVTLLAPESHPADLALADTADLGREIGDRGEGLYRRGCLPGSPAWEYEDCLEFAESIELWRSAIVVPGSPSFNEKVQKAFHLAEAGFGMLGRLGPRLAALRWCCCLCWLAARAQVVDNASAAGCFGTLDTSGSAAACRDAKGAIFEWLRNLTKEAAVAAIFDFDLIGHGVWHTGGREPLPKEAKNEWFRRGTEYDMASLCRQALALPPMDMNASQAVLLLRQSYGSPNWVLPPQEAARHILEKHDWYAEMRQAPIDEMPSKPHLEGLVLHAERPPVPEPDLDDPEVIAKIERGEALGKGLQEDGLPGAIHGSIGLLYAALCFQESVANLRLYPGLLEIEGLVESLLHYGPPFRALDFRGCQGLVDDTFLRLLPLAGQNLIFLDLGECKICDSHVDSLVDALEGLPSLEHLDLASNELDCTAASRLLSALNHRRVDVASIRLDGNPLGNIDEFRDDIALTLSSRGHQVEAGGELVVHLGGSHALRWKAAPRGGSFADRARGTGDRPPIRCTAVKVVRRAAEKRYEQLEEESGKDTNMHLPARRAFVERKQQANKAILDHPIMEVWKRQVDSIHLPDEGDKPSIVGSAAEVTMTPHQARAMLE